jgi:exopolysaccharide biosynthesis polyprenyl glycosylphosphotransferase
VFQRLIPGRVAALSATEFLLIYSCYVAAIYAFLRLDAQVFILDDNGWLRILIVTLCLMTGIYFNDLYSDCRPGGWELIQCGVVIAALAFLAEGLLTYLRLSQFVVPARPMIAGSALTIVALVASRRIFQPVLAKLIPAERILFLGYSDIVQEIWARLENRPEKGLKPLGFLDHADSGANRRLGALDDLAEVVGRTHPDRIVVALTERRSNLPVERLLQLRLSGIRVEDVLTTYETAFDRISTRVLRHSQLIFSSNELGPHPRRVLLQSVYSLAIAIFAVVIASPFMLCTAILIKLTSPGPALFRQERVGKNNRIFTLYKFRSMVAGAEAETGPVWAKPNDVRVTPLGHWLRKMHLDELPQLLNVLKGDMSIVGPRPERPEFVSGFEKKFPYYRHRHCIKPGITGWAQINHKYGDTETDAEIKLEYDLYYIKNLAPALDAFIMFRTAKVMLLSRGAQ